MEISRPMLRFIVRSIRPNYNVYRAQGCLRQRNFSTTRSRMESKGLGLVKFNREPARPDMLRRIANRPLPTLKELDPRRRWYRTLPIFAAVCFACCAGIFNYQKTNSPIIAATLYSLRTNPTVREELGDEVYFASQWAWISGSINLVQGHVDVSFRVKGKKSQGLCRFRANRYGGRSGMFKTEEWSLTMDDGRCIQLLDDHVPGAEYQDGAGPLGAAAY